LFLFFTYDFIFFLFTTKMEFISIGSKARRIS